MAMRFGTTTGSEMMKRMGLDRANMTIYAVYAEELHGDILVDYACGDEEDIRSYFADRGSYGLKLVEVDPIIIEKGYRWTRQRLEAEKAELEQRLRELDTRLKRVKGHQ